MTHNGVVGVGMRFLIIALAWGCMTIKPRIEADHFRACEKLCRGNKGADSMSSVMKLSYAGLRVLSEECACKNNRVFSIMETTQY